MSRHITCILEQTENQRSMSFESNNKETQALTHLATNHKSVTACKRTGLTVSRYRGLSLSTDSY